MLGRDASAAAFIDARDGVCREQAKPIVETLKKNVIVTVAHLRELQRDDWVTMELPPTLFSIVQVIFFLFE